MARMPRHSVVKTLYISLQRINRSYSRIQLRPTALHLVLPALPRSSVPFTMICTKRTVRPNLITSFSSFQISKPMREAAFYLWKVSVAVVTTPMPASRITQYKVGIENSMSGSCNWGLLPFMQSWGYWMESSIIFLWTCTCTRGCSLFFANSVKHTSFSIKTLIRSIVDHL